MIMKDLLDIAIEERSQRENIEPKSLCTFGIKCLDDALIGILKKDFIVIGADSGIGKSELCLQIALHNAKKGRRVGLYFIEGGAKEAVARIKWNLIKDVYYGQDSKILDMDYRKWRMNLLKGELMDKMEDNVDDYLAKIIGDKIKIYCFDEGLTIEDLKKSLSYFVKKPENEDDLMEYKSNVDLLIIDHLQYFTLTNPKDELSEQAEILKEVNNICHHREIPVILVSHLRKKAKDRGLPSQEDFYGTSNIPKMSSISITIASGEPSSDGVNYPTFFRFVKSRTKLNSNQAIMCNFNLNKNKYEDGYQLFNLAQDVPLKTPVSVEMLPRWAKKTLQKVINIYE